MATSKLGRNPFEKNSRSQVGRMIEANFDSGKGEKCQVESSMDLTTRLQYMKISLDLKQMIKTVLQKGLDRT